MAAKNYHMIVIQGYAITRSFTLADTTTLETTQRAEIQWDGVLPSLNPSQDFPGDVEALLGTIGVGQYNQLSSFDAGNFTSFTWQFRNIGREEVVSGVAPHALPLVAADYTACLTKMVADLIGKIVSIIPA
jgi:hypothetical protein